MAKRYFTDTIEKMLLLCRSRVEDAHLCIQSCFSRLLKQSPMQVLFVRDRGCNVPYLDDLLNRLRASGAIQLRVVPLSSFTRSDLNNSDIFIYQTWTWENGSCDRQDELFLEYNKSKILFDANASGSFDNYHRFKDPTIARIKNAPAENFLKEFNVILKTTYPVDPISFKQKPQHGRNENR